LSFCVFASFFHTFTRFLPQFDTLVPKFYKITMFFFVLAMFPLRRRVRFGGLPPPGAVLSVRRCNVDRSHVALESVEPAFFRPTTWPPAGRVDAQGRAHDRIFLPPHHVAVPSEAGLAHLQLDWAHAKHVPHADVGGVVEPGEPQAPA